MPKKTRQAPPEWSTCAAKGCIGICIKGQEYCLAHVHEEDREAFLSALEPRVPLDLRGTPFTQGLIERILTGLRGSELCPIAGELRLDRAEFSEGAGFEGTRFSQDAIYSGARFLGEAKFDGAEFSQIAGFQGAHFGQDAWFEGAQFRDAYFMDARFAEEVIFTGVQFSGHAWFGGAQFDGDASFGGAQFNGDNANFIGTTFGRWAGFVGAAFNGETAFDGIEVAGNASFEEASFTRQVEFGPLLVAGKLTVDGATFEQPTAIEVVSPKLACIGVRFMQGANLALRFTEAILDGTTFAGPSTVLFVEDSFKYRAVVEEGQAHHSDVEALNESLVAKDDRPARPTVLSLRGVDVSHLVLANVDLRACLFVGAHNMDKLRIEGPRLFASSPPAWTLRVNRWRVPVWPRWTRRQTLAEEHHWRSLPSQAPNLRALLSRPSWHQPETQVRPC